MLNRFVRWLFGYVEFAFSGGFADDFLNDCCKNNISIFKVECDDCLSAVCYPADYLRLCRIAKRHGGRLELKRKIGLPFGLHKLIMRPGIAVGSVVFIALFSFLSGFVWNIEIVNNGNIEQSRIISFLDNQGFRVGTYWKSTDKSKIEDLMLASFDEIAWVHINRFGTTARVEIQQATPKPNIEGKAITNLKATKDGVIVSATVHDGWQQCFVGDSVTKGTVLVSGVLAPEEKKENLYAHGSGSFIARVEEDFSLTVSREQYKKEYLGDKQYKAISFFGLYIPLYFGRIPTENAEILRNSQYLKINGNSVPVGIIETNARQYRILSSSLNDSELLSLANRLVKQKLIATYGKDNIASKSISIVIHPSSAEAKGTVEALEEIGEEVPLISQKQKSINLLE